MHLVPPLVGFGVLTTNLVEGLMCLWELQDNTGSSPILIRFTYRRWPLKMCEDIEDNGGLWRYSQWRLWHEKTSHEDFGARRHSCFVVSSSSLLSHRNHRTVKWGPSEQIQSDWCDAQPNPMSLSEDNESKSYLELDESALLVAQIKLPRVVETWPLDTCPFLSDLGEFWKNQAGLSPGYK